MRVGLTGHYASGKSTVSSFFQEKGASIIDTDLIAREVVAPGTAAYTHIIDSFGKEICNADATINRKALANIVFSDSEKLEILNSITHPPVLDITLQRSSNPDTIYIINVPLLFQSGYNRYMDSIIIVTCSIDTLIQRGSHRDSISATDAHRRVNAQNSINEYLNAADYIIDNSYAIEYTRKQVNKIWISLTTNMKAP